MTDITVLILSNEITAMSEFMRTLHCMTIIYSGFGKVAHKTREMLKKLTTAKISTTQTIQWYN